MSAATRTVREDQHGTMAAYNRGCRCTHCRSAKRDYPEASAETLELVYAALEREADLDGIVTETGGRIGELVGMSGPHASAAIRLLESDGRLAVTGTTGPKNRILVIDLGWSA